jgi:gliding motility-associated-like protein
VHDACKKVRRFFPEHPGCVFQVNQSPDISIKLHQTPFLSGWKSYRNTLRELAHSQLFRCIVLALISSLNGLQAQHNNHWFFGEYAGLNFNGGMPNNVNGGKLNTIEGCSAFSDERGQLLFYTDGVSIWDRNHNRMPNGSGMKGHPSSTMSALIVPQPGNDDRYYVFTTAATESPDPGIQYAVVDMRENNGLGDVVQEPVQIANRGSEKLAAIPNLSGDTYWIIGHGASVNKFSDSFMVWALRDTGLQHEPRFIKAGAMHNNNRAQIGYLVPSPDGRLLAEAMDNKLQLFSFDRVSGTMKLKCILAEGKARIYGVAFSPDGRHLYTGSYVGNGAVWQYDLTVADLWIQATETRVSPLGIRIFAMLLGPDGKLYFSEYAKTSLHMLAQPNLPGPQSGFKEHAFELNGKTTLVGLPAFAVKLPTFTHRICPDGTTLFRTNNIAADSIQWEITDSANAALVLHRMSGRSFEYRFNTPGTYSVRVVFYGYLGKDTVARFIQIKSTDYSLFPFRDTLICPGDSLLLYTKANFDEYRWPDASTGKTFLVHQPGIYRLQAVSNGCVYRDSIRITRSAIPQPVFPDSMALCAGTSLTLDAGPDATWRDATLPPRRLVSQPGLYRVRIANACGELDDSVHVYMVDCACYLQLPNAFTPNGDGRNDVFLPLYKGCTFRTYSLKIYSRWGEKLFESADPEFGWNGEVQGKPAPEGVFVFMLFAVDSFGKPHRISGSLTVLK